APKPAGTVEPWRSRAIEIRSKSARELFDLAVHSARAKYPRMALSSRCLRAVLERAPDHAEARRLLGYVPYEGGWASPFVVEQHRRGYVEHARFGWVKKEWVIHLERGELPAPPVRNPERVRWSRADDVERIRSDWRNRWEIPTEHFEILTNVSLAEA